MNKPDLQFKRPEQNGLEFTKVTITKIVKNRAYNANFHFRVGGSGLSMETNIGGTSTDECIGKTNKFLEITLLENEIEIFNS